MRLRLIVSFIVTVLVSVVGVALIARQGTVREVQQFLFPGGTVEQQELVERLQEYYRNHGSWDGVTVVLPSLSLARSTMEIRADNEANLPPNVSGEDSVGIPRLNRRLQVADAEGYLVTESGDQGGRIQLSQQILAGAIPLKVNGQVVGYLVAEGSSLYTQEEEAYLLSRIDRAAMIAGLIAGGVALLLGLLLAYSLLRPVRELTIAARRLAQGDLSQQVRVNGKDELATLACAFNQMASSLKQAEQARQAMTADIAHELRTPLAVQRANLEALQDGIYPLTVDNLSPVLEQNRLLTHLVEDLRTLALADSGHLTLEFVPTNFPDLVQRVVEQFRPQAAGRGIELAVKEHWTPKNIEGQERILPSAPQTLLDPLRVGQILTNLLSNALRHTPDGGFVQVIIRFEEQMLYLIVRDSGPGIPEDALPYIFERFYRAERSRNREKGGSGLGLAIARYLAEAHGGSLMANNHPEGGAVFTLALPICPLSPEDRQKRVAHDHQ